MEITILSVPGCPNAPVARARVAEALAEVLGGRDASVEMVEIADTAEAERRGMTGSPTILIDGTNPFTGPGRNQPALTQPALACRTDGGPTVEDLRNALRTHRPSG